MRSLTYAGVKSLVAQAVHIYATSFEVDSYRIPFTSAHATSYEVDSYRIPFTSEQFSRNA